MLAACVCLGEFGPIPLLIAVTVSSGDWNPSRQNNIIQNNPSIYKIANSSFLSFAATPLMDSALEFLGSMCSLNLLNRVFRYLSFVVNCLRCLFGLKKGGRSDQ